MLAIRKLNYFRW